MSPSRRPLVVLATAVLAIATASPAAAEEVHATAEPGAKNVVLTNVFLYPFGVFNVEYERLVAPRIGIAGGVTGFYSNGTPFASDLRSRGAGLNLGMRYYLLGEAPAGLFAAAFARAFYISVTEDEGMAEGTTVGGGAMVGYAHVFFDRLHVSAAAGAHVLWGDAAGTHLMPSGSTIDPEVRVALGVAF